jgi:hypothetical protein
MGAVWRGFRGRRRRPSAELPPGQYLVQDFPVLSAGPTPSIDLGDWELTVTSQTGTQQRWDWAAFRALPSEPVTVDIHCVTHWSKLGTTWEGVSLDTLLDGVQTSAGFALRSPAVTGRRCCWCTASPNLIYFNEVAKGNHFAAWQEPQLFATEVQAAFRSLR